MISGDGHSGDPPEINEWLKDETTEFLKTCFDLTSLYVFLLQYGDADAGAFLANESEVEIQKEQRTVNGDPAVIFGETAVIYGSSADRQQVYLPGEPLQFVLEPFTIGGQNAVSILVYDDCPSCGEHHEQDLAAFCRKYSAGQFMRSWTPPAYVPEGNARGTSD